MLLTTLLLAWPLLQQAVNTSGGELRSDQAGWDVLHYDLELKVDPEQRSIAGRLTMRARALEDLEQLSLDLDQALYREHVDLWVGERDPLDESSPFQGQEEGRIWVAGFRVPAGAEFSFAVTYSGQPSVAPNPPWKGGFTWSTTEDGRPWIATSCQGEGADLWWPCKDHPSDKAESMDLRITVPDGLFCASNGVLVSDETWEGTRTLNPASRWQSTVKTGKRWRTLHWRVSEPIANYTVALNIAPYEVLEETFTSVDGTRVPAFFWHLPENAAKAKEHFPEFLDHLRHLESVCGPYPFRSEKYGIAETPHLGMEHQTIIAYGNEYRGGPDGFDWLHHHELAHEWWANLVTCRDWKDMWLHEGFATYMQALYAEEKNGAEGLQKFMRRVRALLGNRNPVAPLETKDSQQIYFQERGQSDSDIYYKGAWVLHTLRWQLGDETFFELLRRFAYPTEQHLSATDGSQVRFVDTEDLRDLAEEVSDLDLGWFFELYLRQPHLPRLEVERDGDALAFTWIVPAGQTCLVDVPITVEGRARRIDMSAGQARIDVTGKVEVDPAGWLLMD